MSRAHEYVFPQHVRTADDITLCHSDGMTLREYYAGLAMQGMIASEADGWSYGDNASLAKGAVARADALIAALEGK